MSRGKIKIMYTIFLSRLNPFVMGVEQRKPAKNKNSYFKQ